MNLKEKAKDFIWYVKTRLACLLKPRLNRIQNG